MSGHCEWCGVPVKKGRRFCCSGHAGQASLAGSRKQPTAQPDTVETFMAQPEIQNLRAGIQVAVRTALERTLGVGHGS